MLTEYKEREIERTKQILSAIEEDLTALSTEIEEIDEKYRKMAEEEKAEANATVDYYNSQKEFYSKRLTELGGTMDEPLIVHEVKPRKRRAKKEETPVVEEEKVVDTIFPENNENETETTESVAEESLSQSQADLFSETDIVKEEESAPDSEEKTEEVIEDVFEDNDGFPDFPEEW